MAREIRSAEQFGSFFKALELGESALRARHLRLPALLTPMRALLTADTCACQLYLLLCHALVQEEAARGEARKQRHKQRDTQRDKLRGSERSIWLRGHHTPPTHYTRIALTTRHLHKHLDEKPHATYTLHTHRFSHCYHLLYFKRREREERASRGSERRERVYTSSPTCCLILLCVCVWGGGGGTRGGAA